jgi:hypothetical protein
VRAIFPTLEKDRPTRAGEFLRALCAAQLFALGAAFVSAAGQFRVVIMGGIFRTKTRVRGRGK